MDTAFTRKGKLMTEHQAKIILAYAKNGMRAGAAGKELFMAGQNVHHHLRKIKRDTGLNPKNFFDLCRLVGIAASVKGASL